MCLQPVYDEIALDYEGHIVVLRPSLRAAIHLEKLHGGFTALLRKIEEFDTRTVWHIITQSAGRAESNTLFAHAATQPLNKFKDAVQAPLFQLITALMPQAGSTDTTPANAAPMSWPDAYRELYKIGTGWLGWTPKDAWAATPDEIITAFEAHIDRQRLMNGGGDDSDAAAKAVQRRENEALGLDPEFDRAGLRRLKAMASQREGQHL